MRRSSAFFLQFIENRSLRLYTSLGIACLLFFLTRNKVSGFICLIITWVGFATSLLILAWITMATLHPRKVKRIAEQEDLSSTLIFLFVVLAATISLFAIVYLLQTIPNESKRGLSLHVILAIASIACSWTLIHTIFTLRYAHFYYIQEDQNLLQVKQKLPGLTFPDEDEPDYFDFAYFSFVLGMTFQVSDVVINSKKIRRLALIHGMLSFVYNTVIVALSINIISGIVAK